MKLKKKTLRVLCGATALLTATVSVAASTAGALPALPGPAAPSILPSIPLPIIESPSPEAEGAPSAPGGEAGTDYVGKKSETVYVNLRPDGSVRETIVTDWLHSDTAGVVLPDRTDLTGLYNVKGDEAPVADGDGLKWKLEGSDLYYRGKSDKPLPLSVSISYFLDGRELPAERIAGKSGKLEIRLRFQNTTRHEVTIAGKQVTMHTPLMVMAGMSLSNDHFSNVRLSDGSLVSDGSNQVVAIVAMPGLKESLGIGGYSLKEINDFDFPEEFTITADVRNFEMGPIGIAVTTELPNLDEIKRSEDIDDMRRDLHDLQEMQNDLDRADPDRDIRSLITDPQRTEAAQLLVDDIFDFYDMNKDLLEILPKYITDENIRLYDRIKHDLKDSTLDTMLDDEVAADLLGLVDELEPNRLQSLADDFDGMDLRALRTLMDRSFELAALLGTEDSQKNLDTIKQLAACRESLTGLLGDAVAMEDSQFQELVYSVIAAKIPGAGTIDDQQVKQLLTLLLKDVPGIDISDLLGRDMAAGYSAPITYSARSSERNEAPERPAESQGAAGGGGSGADPEEATRDETNPDGEGTENPDAGETGPDPDGAGDEAASGNPDENTGGGAESDGGSDNPENGGSTGGADSADSASSGGSDGGSTEGSSDGSDSGPDGVSHTETLSAYVTNEEPQTGDTNADEAPDGQPAAETEAEPESGPTDEKKTGTPSEGSNGRDEDAPPEGQARETAETVLAVETFETRAASGGASDTPRQQILDALRDVLNSNFDAICRDDRLLNNSDLGPLLKMRNHTMDLKAQLAREGLDPSDPDALQKLGDSITFANLALARVEQLQPLAEQCFAPLLRNKPDSQKPEIIRGAMEKLTNDLADNKENFTTMLLLLKKLDEENLKDDLEYIDELRDDMRDLRPIVDALNRDLRRADINLSLHESPETTGTLLRMKDDLETHRDISETLRNMLQPWKVDLGRNMISTLDRLQGKDAVGGSLEKMDDLDELLDRKEAFVALSEQYRIYSDAPEELDTDLKFVMKTDNIDAPEEAEPVVAPAEEKGGFLDWCKGMLDKLTGKNKG